MDIVFLGNGTKLVSLLKAFKNWERGLKIVIASLFLGFLSMSVVAGGSAGMGKIKALKIGQNPDHVKIILDLAEPAYNEKCTSGQVIIHMSQNTENNYQNMIAVSLAAYMSNKTVRYYSYSDDCNVTYVTLSEEYM